MTTNSNNIVIVSIDGLAQFYMEDPNVHMPHLNSLVKRGTAAGMKSIFPTATWAIHTSLATGCYPRKHGVLGNWVIDRNGPNGPRVGEHFGDRTWSKEETVLKETFYDAAKKKGWSTASICWPKTRNAPTVDHNIPEFYEQELFEQYSTPALWSALKEKGLPVENYGAWSTDHARGHMQDWLTTEIAKYVIEEHQPNLLMVHYLLPDSYQHDFGTRSNEVYWSLSYIDEQIGKLIDSLKAQGIWEKTNMFVVSDHGFVDTSWTFYPNLLFSQKGWFDPANFETNTTVAAVSNGGSGYVYIHESDEIKRKELIREVYALLLETEHVKHIYCDSEFHSIGLPEVGELDDHRPDLVFEMEEDCFVHYGFEGAEVIAKQAKFKGMHGFSPELDDMKAIFVASGPDIEEGMHLPEVNAIDVAPTLANLIGYELVDIDGSAINCIRKGEPSIGTEYSDTLIKGK